MADQDIELTKSPADETTAVKSHGGRVFAISVFLSVLVIALAGYYFVDQLRSKQEGLGKRTQDDKAQIQQLSKQLNNLQPQLTALQTQLSAVQARVATADSRHERVLSEYTKGHTARMDHLKANTERGLYRIQRQLGRTRSDWLVGDAEFLLSIANQRLELVGDVHTSIKALEAADQRLRESGDPGVIKIRGQIASEIGILKRLKTPDIVGLFSRLREMEKRVSELPVFMPHAGKLGLDDNVKLTTEKSGNSLIDELKGLIDIRRTDRAADIILIPEEVALIRQELRINLEMARYAVVERNEQLYRANLEDAKNWLNKKFDTQAPATIAMIADLDALIKEKVTMVMPDISRSLNMLRSVAKLRVEYDKAIIDDPDGKGAAAAGKSAPGKSSKKASGTEAPAKSDDKGSTAKGNAAQPGSPAKPSAADLQQQSETATSSSGAKDQTVKPAGESDSTASPSVREQATKPGEKQAAEPLKDGKPAASKPADQAGSTENTGKAPSTERQGSEP